MTIRTFWLNLGWLVMLVVTVAVPLVLDAVGRLTYFTSLALWGIPILYLWPVFNIDHGGRHRTAAAGVALDRRHDRRARRRARLRARIPDVAVPGLQRACGRRSLSVVSARRGWQDPGRGAAVLRDGPRGHGARVRVCRRALAEPLQPQRRPAGSQTDSAVAASRDRRGRRRRRRAGALARERNLSDLFCVPRGGRRRCRRCSCTGPSAT